MHLSRVLAHRIATRHGVVTATELLVDGTSTHSLRCAVTGGELVRLHDGVYRVATSPDTFESRCVAACLAEPSTVVTGLAAGRLWGFRHVRPTSVPIVLARHDTNHFAAGVAVRRTNVLDDTDHVLRSDGIRVATPPRAWFDCARDLSDDAFEALTEWVLDRHSSMPTLWSTVRRLDARGRPGLARVRRVLSRREAWQRPAGSRLELKVIRAVERRGVPRLLRQHPIRLPNGIVIHPDAADPAIRWALEIDHVTWHGGRADAQRDKGRDRQLRRLRWEVHRVTDQELSADFAAVVDEIVELYWIRAREVAS
jgi:very-short-patch-repair endonuclease